MKILLSANTSWYLWNFRAGLITSLVEREHEVLLLSPEDNFCEKLEKLGCRLIRINIDGKGKNIVKECCTLLKFIKVCIQEKPDALLSFTVKPVMYGGIAAGIVGIPSIPTITGLGTVFIRVTALTKVIKLLYRISLMKASRIFFQNKIDHDLFLSNRLVEKDKLEVVPGSGVDCNHFEVQPFIVGREQSHTVFLYTGRLLRDKGVNEYVEAALQVKKLYPNVKFYLLGPTGVSNETAIGIEQVEQWEKSGSIEYLGETDDVRPYIYNVDCVVLPSYREGMPRALLEAAAMGRPLIASNSVGCVDIVKDQINGLLCRTKDPNDLALKMIDFVQMPVEKRRKMGLAGRALVEREYNENYVIERYLEALRDAVS